jgi:peptidoglycan/LPS O-acetylase OafA/YrhL
MNSPDRLHALDAVRGFALILGIFFHGAASYVEHFPEAFWPMREPSSAALGLLFFASHMFRMSLFFLLAGFFGRMLLERKGVGEFVRDRARRILLPLVVGLPVILLLTGLLIGLGFVLSGRDLAELQQIQAQQQRDAPRYAATFPWAHLWFLYYLLMFYAAALIARALRRLAERVVKVPALLDAFVRWCLGGVWGAAAIGLPLAAYFANLDGWSSWTGLPAPLTLAPHLPSLLSYGTAFAFGWIAYRHTGHLLALKDRAPVFCTLGVVLTVISLYLGGTTPRFEPYLDGALLPWYAATYLVGAWCWIFGVIGFGVRHWSDLSPVRRYLADSSYFLYLMHLPVLAFFAAWWNPLPWHWTVKYPLQIAATIAVLLVSYRYLVRATWLGATLNGRRYPRTVAPPPVRPPVAPA